MKKSIFRNLPRRLRMSELSMEIGKRIRYFRTGKNMTLEELATAVCKSKATLSKYEKGDIVIDIETMYEIANALQIHIEERLDIGKADVSRPTLNRSGIGGAVLLGKRWTVLDPLASLIVGAFIVKVSFDLINRGISELMEKSLPDEIEDEIMAIAQSEPDVIKPHDLRTRRIGNRYAIELHILMSGDITLSKAHDHADSIENQIKEKFGQNTHVAIHMEPLETENPT